MKNIAPKPFVLNWTSLSDTGLVRKRNEDTILVEPEQKIFIVADGMGGHQAGHIASSIAAKTVIDTIIAQKTSDQSFNAIAANPHTIGLHQAITAANDSILNYGIEHRKYKNMGTTIVAAWFYDEQITVGHVGDSRLYRLRNHNQWQKLTSDHSLVEEQLYHEKNNKPLSRHLITRALGISERVAIDLIEDYVLPGDLYLICTDGLYGLVADSKILSVLQQDKDLENLAHELIQLGKQAGGYDNLSVCLIRAEPFKSNEAAPWKRWLTQKFRSSP